MSTPSHTAVLLEEAVSSLVTNRSGRYVDGTYGRGGHSQAIADRLDAAGRLMVIDRDLEAIEHACLRFAMDDRISVHHAAFSELKKITGENSSSSLDGILLDLGVSSPQLDEPQRGFSFSRSGPLDMRMDQSEGETAAQWLSRADETHITDALKRYGEERFARRIARGIIAARSSAPVNTTEDLVQIIETAIPFREKNKHPATRTFQAIRIQVNQELQELETCLFDVIDLLKPGGRLVVISFHSLEDRIVKRFFRRLEKGDDLPSRLPIRDAQLNKKLRLVGKPVRASVDEIERNRRSRSSIMRIAEKL